MKTRAAVGVAAVLWAATAGAEEPRSTKPVDAERSAFVTRHSGTFGGQPIEYTATAGETIVRGAAGQSTAAIFTVGYTRDGVADLSTQPVTFLYNGGPGASSLWLHMGAFGPRVVRLPAEPGDDGAPPYAVEDNPATILDVTDLVFVDPVGTGFSRPLGETKAKDFFGIREDARSIAAFVEAWAAENGRWNSPKYLIGESYGTTRTGAVTKQLLDRRVGLSGVVLVSGVLHYQNNRFTPGNVMAHVSFLPSYAATAWYHERLPNRPADLEAFLTEVRDFARGEYARALIAGNRLETSARESVIERLHGYTGLSKAYLDGSNMRVSSWRFQKELLRDDGLVVGRADSRYVGSEADVMSSYPESDPMVDAIEDAFVAAMHEHYRTFLQVRMARPYEALGDDAHAQWRWLTGRSAPSGGRFVNVVPYLEEALRRNADFRILVAGGCFDLATPFFGAENAMAELRLGTDRVTFASYRSGHMLYLQGDVRREFLEDVRRFVAAEPWPNP